MGRTFFAPHLMVFILFNVVLNSGAAPAPGQVPPSAEGVFNKHAVDGKLSKDNLLALMNEKVSDLPQNQRAEAIASIERDLDREFNLADTNSDGSLDAQEFMALVNGKQLPAMFTALDVDQDGILSKAEVKASLAHFAPETTNEEFDEDFESADTDGDGLLSQDEFPAFVQISKARGMDKLKEAEFNKHDTDKDGKLDKSELSALFTALYKSTGQAQAFDTDTVYNAYNTDGEAGITLDEFLAQQGPGPHQP